jgi:hypothetical protein
MAFIGAIEEPAELVVRVVFVAAVAHQRRTFSSLRWQRAQPIHVNSARANGGSASRPRGIQ